MIGQTVSHYKIVSKIGQGGMGEVYLAEDTRLDRRVALKFLAPELASDHESLIRFRNEAKAAAELSHPNIATLYDIGNVEGKPFLVLEYLEGQTLRERVAQGPLPIEDVLRIGKALAAGLAEAHSHGIIHRDIKSANVMLTEKGDAKILDFGLAHRADATQITREGTTLGTIGYMSPEQARGERADERSDIWSLGVVLYECLTGRLPFTGEGAAVIEQIKTAEATPPTALRTGIPMELERVFLRCVQKDSSLRYQHADDVLAELKLVEMGSGRGTSQASELASPNSSTDSSTPEYSRTHAAAGARGKRLWIVVGATVVIFAALAFFLGRGEQEPPSDFALTVAAPREKSIAVLPFTNLSGDPENEYFSDGITEDILAQLSKIADLTVISRTSVMRYKNTEKSLREIGKELRVATILEGSVRRSEDRVRIVGQLIDARSDKHLWADTYDRDLKDIFEVQSDVAKQIALALEAELSPEEKERIEKKPTGDLRAYDYYLKGRVYANRYTEEDTERALGLYQKALSLDPNYALAYAGFASAYAQQYFFFDFGPASLDSAITVAEKALSIDPDLAEAHVGLGNAYYGKGWYRKALESYQRAVEIKPNYSGAVGNIGMVHDTLGEKTEALRWYKKSMALNPTDFVLSGNIGLSCADIGDYAKAEQWFRRALEIAPDYSTAEFQLILVNLIQGNGRQALEQIEKWLSKYPDNVGGLRVAGEVAIFLGQDARAKEYFERTAELASGSKLERYANIRSGYLLWKAGERDEARKKLSECLASLEHELEQGDKTSTIPHSIAAIHAVQGEKKEACEWLQKALDAGQMMLPYPLSIDPLFKNLRNEACFKEKVAQLETKVDEIRKEIEAME